MSKFSEGVSHFIINSSQQTIKKINLLVFRMSHFLELLLALLLTLGLILSAIQLFPSLFELHISFDTTARFSTFLEDVFTLMVGVEALKMLCKHSPGSTLEVLMFAMARAIVVEHTNVVFMVCGIVCITLIFFIRKFLYVHDFDTEPEEGSIFAEINPDEHLFGPSMPAPITPHKHQRRPRPTAEETDAFFRMPAPAAQTKNAENDSQN